MSDVELWRAINDLRGQVDALTALQRPDQNLSTDSTPAFGGGIIPGTDNSQRQLITSREVSLAAAATTQADPTNTKPYALFILRVQGSGGALYWTRGGVNAVTEISDPEAVWGTSAGASTYNLYYNAGTTSYLIQNNSGSTVTFQIIEIKIG